MKKIITTISGAILSIGAMIAQNDTLNVIRPFNSTYLEVNAMRPFFSARAVMHTDDVRNKYYTSADMKQNAGGRMSVWMGGVEQGTVRASAAGFHNNISYSGYYYQNHDFWPGPLDTITGTTDSATMFAYNRIWKVNNGDIQDFISHWNDGSVQNGSFTPAPAIMDWPAHGTGNYSRNLAPFVDVNGDGVYNPLTGGDYPKIRGVQMIYWIINDAGATQGYSRGGSLGVEVHISAYAYACSSLSPDEEALNNTTLYHYRIINRSGNDISDFYMGLNNVGNLGYYKDDYIGCLPSKNIGFMYNGDNFDEDAFEEPVSLYLTNLPAYGYKGATPFLSCQILKGPLAPLNDAVDNDNDGVVDENGEQNLMTSFNYYNNTADPKNGNPHADTMYYDFMRGLWGNGSVMTQGGAGVDDGNPATKFVFDGNVLDSTAWTERNAWHTPDNRNFLLGCGPVFVPQQGNVELDFSLVFSQDSVNCANSFCPYTKMLMDNEKVKQWFDANSFPSCLTIHSWGVEEKDKQQLKVYPNPSSHQLTVQIPEGHQSRIVVSDLAGRVLLVAITEEGKLEQTIDISSLNAGLYFVQLTNNQQRLISKWIKE